MPGPLHTRYFARVYCNFRPVGSDGEEEREAALEINVQAIVLLRLPSVCCPCPCKRE